jgi:hypothetical protein
MCTMIGWRERTGPPRQTVTLMLACIAVLWSALQFWPFEDSKIWQLLYPANLAPVVWVGLLVTCGLWRRKWEGLALSLPHVSVLAYLALCVLSIAFAREFARPTSFAAKLVLMYIGGYGLFCAALRDQHSVRLLFHAVVAAVVVSVIGSFLFRFYVGRGGLGFHGDAQKYGTYIGILVPLAGTYLLTMSGWQWVAGAALIAAGIFAAGTTGAVLAIVAAAILLIAICPERRIWARAIGALICGVSLSLMFGGRAGETLWQDAKLMEADGANVRQRYLEWQAEMNLLEDHAVVGTGAGSINEYRSAYYRRLPKLNTLAPFDQNGWLATAAETGILGLVAFCWVAGHYGQIAWRGARKAVQAGSANVLGKAMIACATALGAAFIANLFCSVHYNGVLIAFVLLLAFISSVSGLQGDSSGVAS